jgi:protein O-mannosyl-transferase
MAEPESLQAVKIEHWTSQLRFVVPILGLAILLVYSNSFTASWHLDDRPGILDNKALQNFDWLGLWSFQKTRFLTYLSLAINAQISGQQTLSFHLTNSAIHWLNAILLFLLGKSLTKNQQTSPFLLLCVLFFALHPLATSAVTYIVQRAETLCASFLFGALLLYSHGRQNPEHPWSKRSLWGAFSCGIGALLCKEVGVSIAPLIILLEFCFFTPQQPLMAPGRGKELLRTVTLYPWFGLCLLFPVGLFALGLHSQLFQARSLDGANDQGLTYGLYQLTQFKVFAHYLQLSFVPLGQSIDHSVSLVRSPLEPAFLLSFVLFIGLAFGSYKFGASQAFRCFTLPAILFVLAPSSSVFVLPDLMFEHRFYIPLGLLALWIFSEINQIQPPKSNRAFMTAIALLAILGVLGYQRNAVWQTEGHLWHDAVLKGPNKPRCLTRFGNAVSAEKIWRVTLKNGEVLYAHKDQNGVFQGTFSQRGRTLENTLITKQERPLELSQRLYLRALESNSQYSKARINLGICYVQAGKAGLKEAQKLKAQWTRSPASSPLNKRLRRELKESAEAFMADFQRAETEFKRVIDDKAENFVAYNNLAHLYNVYLLDSEKAKDAFRKVLKFTKSIPSAWFFLGNILRKHGKKQQALDCYREYLESGDQAFRGHCEEAVKKTKGDS